MTPGSFHRSLRLSVVSFLRNHYAGALLAFLLTMLVPSVYATQADTTTTLDISATSVPYKTPIILTATVTAKANGSPVSAGFVLFCDATAPYCENNSALGRVQLTAANATAVVKIGSGPLGTHSYKAVYRANNNYASSASDPVYYTVQGTYSTTTTLLSSGKVGNYTLTGNVTGVGSLLAAPSGNISFIDTSAGNKILGTQSLSTSTLNDTFTQAPNSPFSIASSASQGTTSTRSVAIASEYLNGDNNLDLVTANDDQTITVLLGNGNGSFQPKVNYTGCVKGSPTKILLGDFNRDGNSDIALGCSGNGGLAILLGRGDGTFHSPVSYSSGDVEGLAMGDFNGDGILDIALTDKKQEDVTIFIGNGDGTFHSGVVVVNTSNGPNDVVVADFNGDGNDDLAYAVTSSSTKLSDLYIALGNGDGTFKGPVSIASNIGEFLTTGDTNGDNVPDIISTTVQHDVNTNIGNSLFVLIGNGNGTGTFNQTVTYVSDIPSDPHLADVNSDGKPDIIAGGSSGALVYLGNGNGTFQAYSEPAIGGFQLTYAVNAGDYNNDGNADLVGTDARNYQAAVSLSEVQQVVDASALTGVALFPLGSGTHYVDASYSGTVNSIFLSSTSSTVSLMAAPTPTTLTLSVAPTSASLAGQPVTLTATLDPYTVGPPTTTTDGGSIKFFSGATYLGSGTLSSGVATLITTTLDPGSDTLQAAYLGDVNGNYKPSSSSNVSVTVASILLASSPNPSPYGQTVTFTATVPSGQSGNVTFKDGGTALGTVPLTGSTASFQTSTLTARSHDITATYNGDGSHPVVTSPIVTQVVNTVTPSIAVTTSGASVYGDTVTITAKLSLSGPTGSVVFTSGSTALGTGTINASGVATITTSTLPAGTDPITASYAGDGNYNAATNSTTQTVAKRSLVTHLTSSINPSLPGASVTFTDTLSSGVTGTVKFMSGTTLLGTSSVTDGIATLQTSTLPLGSDPIAATYNGDSNNNGDTATMVQTVAKATPVITVTTPGASIYGSSVTITVSLSSSASVTGTVTVTSNGITLGSGSANNPITITTSTLPVGNNLITASYPGDSTNDAATGTANQIVAKAQTTLALRSSLDPSFVNQAVTFTATPPVNATGNITFASDTTTIGTSPITNGVATITTSTLPTGSDLITATYAGDSNNEASSGNLIQTVNKTTPEVTVTTSGPSTYGDPVQITVTVPSGATGTVTITTTGNAPIGTGTLSPTGTVTVTTTTLPVGNDPINVSYSGDTNNNQSTGTVMQIVSKVALVITLDTSVTPSTVNQAVTFTASLSSTTATGTITFYDGSAMLAVVPVNSGKAATTTSTLSAGSHKILATYSGDTNTNSASSAPLMQTVNKQTPVLPAPSVSPTNTTVDSQVTISETVPPGVTGPVTFYNGPTPIGSAPIVNGVATITITTLPVGSDPITASTPADANNNSATSPATLVTVNMTTPTIKLVSSIDPSTAGQSVTFTATVPTIATGSIVFLDGSATLGSSSLSNGQASFTTNSLTVGSHNITATYAGDSSYYKANSPTLIQTVNKASPSLPAPSVSATTLTPGSPETITETVPPGIIGPVTFYNGSTPIGTAPIVNGVATITISTLPLGTDSITASTPSDSNNNAATSPVTLVTVSKLTPTVVLSSSANPAAVNESVTFTAIVPAAASGSVTFRDGSNVLGTGAVNAAGLAIFTTSTLTIGSHTITASYGGNTSYDVATSSPLGQTIGKIPTAITLSPSAPTQLLNNTVTFAATVTAASPTPTGTVTFMEGTTVLGTTALNTNGTVVALAKSADAAYATSALTAGTHQIVAVYSGDANFAPSTSAPVSYIVQDFTNNVNGTASQNLFPGDKTSYKFDLAPLGATTFLNDLNLTVTGLPPGTTYTFTPATIAAGSGTTSVVLDITTSNSLSAQNRVPKGDPMSQRGLPIAMGMLGLFGLGVVRKHGRRMPRMLMVLLLLLGSLLPVVGLSGCAGGYFTLTPTTYSVNVTGTEGSIQHTATATLIVQ